MNILSVTITFSEEVNSPESPLTLGGNDFFLVEGTTSSQWFLEPSQEMPLEDMRNLVVEYLEQNSLPWDNLAFSFEVE